MKNKNIRNIRSIKLTDDTLKQIENIVDREWLVTNGLGGYASGTVSGVNTRRYHGLLISSLSSPPGRAIMLNQLNDTVYTEDGERIQLMGEERKSCALQLYGNCYLTQFSLEKGLPVWRYNIHDIVLEKRLFMRYQQNTMQLSWKYIAGKEPIILELNPRVHFRNHCDEVNVALDPYITTVAPDHFEISAISEYPGLKLLFYGPEVSFSVEGKKFESYVYRLEESHGYVSLGSLWTPGYFRAILKPGQELTMVASTHDMSTIQVLSPEESLDAESKRRELLLGSCHKTIPGSPLEDLVFSADQFVVTPAGRQEDATMIRATGGDIRTVIAGYHWFTDWGRDTMISLEGLTLLTGRFLEARWILHTFSHYIRRGLIPNMFPEAKKQGIYNTADATLWFFHALDRYLEYTGDRTTLNILLPKLLEIIKYHINGTDFGIGVDPADGLLRQGAEGFALTWMDAKVGDWVVTPRRGKTVEINALWYNALCLMHRWVMQEMGEEHAEFLDIQAKIVKTSFNQRFWYAQGGYLYDLVDGENGDDTSCRPNQLFSFALHFPVLQKAHWESVIKVTTEKLLTPVGLRSLSPDHADYKPKYFGDIHSRDAAYHQGTVWAWLIGPYINAWLRLYPDKKAEAREFLKGFIAHMDEACIGSISEIFDAEKPFTPRGCIAQAWSVAEVIRSWIKTNPTTP